MNMSRVIRVNQHILDDLRMYESIEPYDVVSTALRISHAEYDALTTDQEHILDLMLVYGSKRGLRDPFDHIDDYIEI